MSKIQSLIKSKNRVQNYGEVFTSKKEVENMIELLKTELVRPESRFLEPACGDGNFLVEILEKKISFIRKNYKKNQLDYERYSILSLSSLYGIDLLKENIDKSKENLKKIILDNYEKLFVNLKEDYKKTVNYILNKNLLLGDALSLKISKKNKKPIIFSEWAFVDTMKLKRRDFTFKHLIDARPFDGFNLFSDLGDEAIIPEPYKEYDSIYFLKVYELN